MNWELNLEEINGNIVILGHHNGDPDALGSAQGVKELIEKLKPECHVEIIFPEGISKLSRNIATTLNLDIKDKPSKKPDSVIIVDTGKLSQIGEWKSIIKPKEMTIIIIDHHPFDSELRDISNFYINNSAAQSTSEIVYNLFEQKKFTPTLLTAKALLTGIAFDSKFFKLGDSQMFSTVSNLLEITGEISKIHDLMKTPVDISEKIARITAAKRLQIHRIKDWIIITSHISSHQSSGARGIISLGADVAIVAGQKKEKIRASLRSTNKFYDSTFINLGYIASELGHLFNGSGSGHPIAAGVNGTGTLEDFNIKTIELLKKKIN